MIGLLIGIIENMGDGMAGDKIAKIGFPARKTAAIGISAGAAPKQAIGRAKIDLKNLIPSRLKGISQFGPEHRGGTLKEKYAIVRGHGKSVGIDHALGKMVDSLSQKQFRRMTSLLDFGTLS